MANLNLIRITFIFTGLICCLLACHEQTPTIKTSASVPTAVINRMIDTGDKYVSANKDTLRLIADRLEHIYQTTGNKVALTYAGLFKSDHYWLSADYKNAMQQAVKTLADAEKWKVNKPLPDIYGVMGNLHKENGNYKMAFEDADKGIAAARANHDTAHIIATLGLKAMFVRGLSVDKHEPYDKDSSTRLQFKALKIAESSPAYEMLRIRFYDNLAQHYVDLKSYDTAIYYGYKGVQLAQKYGQRRSLTYAYTWIGEAWYFKGEKKKGLSYLEQALQIAKQIKQPHRVMEIQQYIYDCYTLSSNYKEANVYLVKARDLRDSLQLLSNEKQISELQIKYETVKKDQQIVHLKEAEHTKATQLEWILAWAAVVAVFIAILLYQFQVIRQNNRVIKAGFDNQNKALSDIAFIQSHHLRKPVASILGLMNVIRAEDYTAERDVLDKLEEATLELDEKIKAINEHTEIPL